MMLVYSAGWKIKLYTGELGPNKHAHGAKTVRSSLFADEIAHSDSLLGLDVSVPDSIGHTLCWI
jgi:hypothetical protein